jgi:SAM-dependent methyltransferase
MSTFDVLTLPFDQYQRYTVAAQIAEGVRAHLAQPRLRVLDVGGFYRTVTAEKILPLAHFLPQDQVVAVDRVRECLPGYAVADGRALPFGGASFDLVVSCDTLEHVPPAGRPAFVDELLRVTRHTLVLIAPFDSESTRLAEVSLQEYLAAQGICHDQLQEHIVQGLPDASAVRTWLSERGLAFVEFADGYLPHWLIMMVIKHTPGPPLAFQLDLDRSYNQRLSPTDRREPAYRRAFVVAVQDDHGLLPAIAEQFRPTEPASAAAEFDLVARLVTALNQAGPDRSGEALRALEAQLAGLREGQAALEVENRSLRQTIQAYERGRFIRFMRQVDRWRRGLGR